MLVRYEELLAERSETSAMKRLLAEYEGTNESTAWKKLRSARIRCTQPQQPPKAHWKERALHAEAQLVSAQARICELERELSAVRRADRIPQSSGWGVPVVWGRDLR